MKNKKLLLGLGASVLAFAPVAAVVSCGSNITFTDAKISATPVNYSMEADKNDSSKVYAKAVVDFAVDSASSFRFPEQNTFPGSVTNIKQGQTSLNVVNTEFALTGPTDNKGLSAKATFYFDSAKAGQGDITFDVTINGVDNPENQNYAFQITVKESGTTSQTTQITSKAVTATDLGANTKTAEEFKAEVNKTWIIQNKEKLFTNGASLTDANLTLGQVAVNSTTNTTLEIKVTIANNDPATEQTISITGFKAPAVSQQTTNFQVKSTVAATDLGISNASTTEVQAYITSNLNSVEQIKTFINNHKAQLFTTDAAALTVDKITAATANVSSSTNTTLEIKVTIANNNPSTEQTISITGFKAPAAF